MPGAKEPPYFIMDRDGKHVAVVVDLEQYELRLDAAEELEDIKAYDEEKASHDEAIPFDLAVRKIE